MEPLTFSTVVSPGLLAMRLFIGLVLLSSLAATADCGTVPTVESTEDLGFGFHHDVIAESAANAAERIGHFDYLFYHNRKLSQSDKFAVARTGAAIVYQDGPSGMIFLFRRKDGETLPLTRRFIGLVERFQWYESEGYISALTTDAKGNKRWTRLEFKFR
jgi:hypothetical protein